MVNKVILIGNLGNDPECKYSQNGTAITSFSIATSEKYKDEIQTEWHKIITFGKLAEICNKYLSKGSKVYIEGKIQTRKWEDKNGSDHYTTEILANTMKMLGDKKDDTPF